METMQAIAARHSCRSFGSQPVATETLDAILKAGCAAPVGRGEYAGLCMTVIQNRELLHELSDAGQSKFGRDPLYNAPLLVVLSARPGAIANIEYANVACVIENMLLAATDLGVSSIFLWGVAVLLRENAELSAKLSLPEGFVPIACAALGYGTEPPVPPKKLEQTIALYTIL